MKKNGFTLVELLGVIIVLGVIALIIFPNVTKIMKNSKQKLYDRQVNLIEDNARRWGVAHTHLLPETGTYYLNLNELVTGGYISQSEIKDPRNESIMNGCVLITYSESEKKYLYHYMEDPCTNNNVNESEI